MIDARRAEAAGCLTGAATGAVAGHYAGHHAVTGAIGGCIVGHHMAAVARRKREADATAKNPPVAATPTAPATSAATRRAVVRITDQTRPLPSPPGGKQPQPQVVVESFNVLPPE